MAFEQQVALIAARSSGIGKAAALAFGRAGAKVAALGRTADELQQTVDEITRAGGQAIAVEADISKPDDMRRAQSSRWCSAGIGSTWCSANIALSTACGRRSEELKPEVAAHDRHQPHRHISDD